MAKRRIDQTYTMLDIVVDAYDEHIIATLKQRYPALSLARVTATKFNKDSNDSLKFYIYHWLLDDYKSVILDIKNYYNKYTINESIVAK